jgi:hypothetical protein
MKKYCPYNLTIQQVNEYVFEHDEHGDLTAQTHKLVENQMPTKCMKKACGAWCFGRCTRKS